MISIPTQLNDPTDPGTKVTAIQLPYINGTNFTDNGCTSASPKLHVFAIATS